MQEDFSKVISYDDGYEPKRTVDNMNQLIPDRTARSSFPPDDNFRPGAGTVCLEKNIQIG